MPLGEVVPENQKSTIGVMAASAVLTLVVLSVLAFIEPSAMIVVGGVGFLLLALRFIWLVWRELE